MGTHAAGDRFAMLDPARLLKLPLDRGNIGGQLQVTPSGLGDANAIPVERVIVGEALRPPSPVHLSASIDANGNLNCAWVRRSTSGWNWLDAVDAPIGCATELYRVTLDGALGSISWEGSATSVEFSAAQLSSFGSGAAKLSVVQVGDFAASRPGTLSITVE